MTNSSTSSTSASTNIAPVVVPRPNRRQTINVATDRALRIMSETAHDIRSPLSSVRETVRLVHDGELGELNEDQKTCLSAAIDQCDCVDQMVGEMVQLERLQTGVPRVHRQWLNIATIRHSISQTLEPWIKPREISVVWDINADHDTPVYGDLAMIRRLIVNLVVNAVRETPEGGSILVGVHQVMGSESLQWSIVDRGRGMTENEMREIASRQVSKSGGEGLGLSICRQLSALHFSPLRIESRSGTGTAVSFRTPAASPTSIGERWAQWRVNQREPLRTPLSRAEKQISITATTADPDQQVRVDTPSVTIQLENEGNKPLVDDRASLGTVTLGAAMPLEVAETFDQFLQHQSGMFDLIYRAGERSWVWVFDANAQQADKRIDDINAKAKEKIETIRLSWTDPQSIPLDGRRTAARLTEVLVRESLATPTVAGQELGSPLESEPIPHSETASLRLDREIRSLGKRMQRQSLMLQNQAKRLRPHF